MLPIPTNTHVFRNTMELESQILSAEYTIQNFENLRPEATPFRDSITAYWSGFYHEANRLPDPNIDEEVKGFFKMSKKSNLIGKLYLDNGDGIFSKEDDILLSRRRGNKRDKRRFAASQEGILRINYYEESYIDDDGAVESENGFYFGISNHDFTEEGTEGFHGGGPIDTELGTDLFASYVHPCATQING